MPDINEMRTHLFDVLKGLKNGSVDVATAKAMNETAQVLVNSAKVEVDFLKTTDSKIGSGFFPIQILPTKEPYASLPTGYTAHGTKQIEEIPGGTITTHKMR
jgi:hypothetical protein